MMPCLDCGALARGTRCKTCRRRKEAGRAPHRDAYADPAYRAARRALRGEPCHICGLPGADTVDHVVPLAMDATGGGPENWAPAHRACNSRKG